MEVIAQAELTIDDLPQDIAWPRYELLDGSLHVTPLAKVRHQVVVSRLVTAMARLAPDDLVVLAGVNVTSAPDTLLIPDVAVIRREAGESDALGVAPRDVVWAIEVVSSSTARVDRTLKRDTYIDWGIGTYWLVDPRTRVIERYGEVPSPAWAAGLDEAALLA